MDLTTLRTEEEIKKMPTHRLLSYYRSFRDKKFYNYFGAKAYGMSTLTQPEKEEYKENEAHLQMIKDELDAREHVT